jgi:hypothetical protein
LKKLHREPVEQNKHNLNAKTIRNLKIVNREKLKDFGFWYNKVICGWCISDEVGDGTCCSDNSFWICVYDNEIKVSSNNKKEIKEKLQKENTVDFSFGIYGSHLGQRIEKFYNPKDIENDNDLVIQEKFIQIINRLIDNDILKIT